MVRSGQHAYHQRIHHAITAQPRGYGGAEALEPPPELVPTQVGRCLHHILGKLVGPRSPTPQHGQAEQLAEHPSYPRRPHHYAHKEHRRPQCRSAIERPHQRTGVDAGCYVQRRYYLAPRHHKQHQRATYHIKHAIEHHRGEHQRGAATKRHTVASHKKHRQTAAAHRTRSHCRGKLAHHAHLEGLPPCERTIRQPAKTAHKACLAPHEHHQRQRQRQLKIAARGQVAQTQTAQIVGKQPPHHQQPYHHRQCQLIPSESQSMFVVAFHLCKYTKIAEYSRHFRALCIFVNIY